MILDQRLGEWILDTALQRPAQRTGAVAAIPQRLVQDVLRSVHAKPNLQPLAEQIGIDLAHQHLYDLAQVLVAQRAEDDRLVEAVEELWIERPLDLVQDLLLGLGVAVRLRRILKAHRLLELQVACTDVRGHHDDRVLEVNRAAQAVGQLAVLEDLQQDAEQVGMRLFDFVQQDDGVRRALDALGQLAALFVAHVARRGADQLRHRVLFHEFRHVEADQRLLAAEQAIGKRPRHLGLADTGGAQEEERPCRPIDRFQAGPRAADRPSEGRNGAVLAYDAPVQVLFEAQQLGHLFFFDGGHGHAGPAGDHLFDVILAHRRCHGLILLLLALQPTQVLALLALLVRIESRLLELMVRDRMLHAMDDVLDPLVDLSRLVRHLGLFEFHARTGLVEQVDRLVRQEAVRDVSNRAVHRGLYRAVGIDHGMEFLVALLDPQQHLYRFVLRRRAYLDSLEAALQRTVLLNRLAELVGRRRPDALDLAARQRRLEDIGGIQ